MKHLTKDTLHKTVVSKALDTVVFVYSSDKASATYETGAKWAREFDLTAYQFKRLQINSVQFACYDVAVNGRHDDLSQQ